MYVAHTQSLIPILLFPEYFVLSLKRVFKSLIQVIMQQPDDKVFEL